MNELLLKRLTNLMSVKSIVTIFLTVVFSYLAVTSVITGEQFMQVFTMVISFYFVTQVKKSE